MLPSLTKPQQTLLKTVAWQSIAHGVKTGKPLHINLGNYSAELIQPCATFILLSYQNQPRGCIGNLEAIRPLVADVCENAFAAAFCDKHYAAITEPELAALEIHIDILSPLESLNFSSEIELMEQLRPNQDGLVLQDGSHHASFLPSNWDSLPSPIQFIQHLKQKAGLPATYWSKTVKAKRFTTQRLN